MAGLIESNKGVMLKKGKNLKYVFVTETKQEKMENFVFSCADMIGKPFGTAFRVLNKTKLEVIDPIQVEEYRSEYEKVATDSQAEETKDNRNIVDSGESQKLDKQTIMALRDEGVAGEKIVEKLIQNSATFKDRTEFSKAKYLKKKEKKYIPQFVVLKPSARLLCEMYFFKSPDKILEIRPDTLAQILTWSNVQAGSKVLLMETCRGLIAGAMMERLNTDGTLVQIHQGNNPVRTVVEQFNFTVEDVERLACSFPLEKIETYKELEKSSQEKSSQEKSSQEKSSQEKSITREEMLETILGKKYNERNEERADQNKNASSQNDSNLNVKNNSVNEENSEQSKEARLDNSDTKKDAQGLKEEIKEVDEQMRENVKESGLGNSKMEVNDQVPKENDQSPKEDYKAPNEVSKHPTTEHKKVEDESKDKSEDSRINSNRNNRKRRHGDDRNNRDNESKQYHIPRVSFLTKEQRIVECEKAMKLLSEKQFDCLVIAAKYHPKNILISLLDFLSYSRPFVVFCQYKEPLMDCFVTLKDMKGVVNLELTESWFRNLQVLSNRSHPEIVMSATGGYILRGIKVKP